MKTLKGNLSLDFKAIFTQQHLTDLRQEATAPNATPFLRNVQANHPVNDDAFLGAVLKNALRHFTRDAIVGLFNESGVGGTVSPASIDIVEVPEDFGGSVQPVVVRPERYLQAVPAPAPAEVLPVGLIAEEV